MVERLIMYLTGGTNRGIESVAERVRTLTGLNRFEIKVQPNRADNNFSNIKVDMLTGGQ